VRSTFEVGKRGVVRRDHARARAALDAHVAHGHAAFHRQAADRAPRVLDHVPDAAADADPPDDPQHDVFAGHADRQLTLDAHFHRLRLALRHGLRRQDVLDFARANAEGECAHRSVRAGVAVAAHNGHPGLTQAQLRTNHVHDPLERAEAILETDAELLAIAVERVELFLRNRVRHRLGERPRRRVVVHCGDREIGAAHSSTRQPQTVKGLGRGHLVNQVEVDVQQRGLAGRFVDHVGVPDFFE